MVYHVTITPTALIDIEDALNYYNSISPNLGYRIADDIDASIARISKMPLAYSFRYKNVRAKILAKFPYLIFFICNTENQTKTILRIFNIYKDSFGLK